MNNYTISIELHNTTTSKAFEALTHGIASWWTEMFEGQADQENEGFVVRFGPAVFKKMLVRRLEPAGKVQWLVEDSLINIPELKNQREWINTTIEWTIAQTGGNVVLQLTHIGLEPGIECYTICTSGWEQFIASLKSYIETGKGMPFRMEHTPPAR